MRLSRNPRNLVIVMLMAVFLMVNVAMVGAQGISWTNWSSSYTWDSSLSGTVYETNLAGNVYATVYAGINNGQSLSTPVITSQYIYGSGTAFSIPLSSFTNLVAKTDYQVALTVYAATTAANANATSGTKTAYLSGTFQGTSGSGGSGGGGGGGAVTTTTTTTTAPSITATIGTPVAVTAASGATISATGVTIAVPAGALAADVKVTVTKVAETASLSVPATSKLVSDVLEIIKDKTGDFSKPVTLTLDFDKTKVDTTKFDVKVCFFDEKAKTWVALDNIKVADGKVSGDVTHFTKFAVLTFPKTAATTTTTVSGLNDITGHWAAANIQKLVDLKAIAGYPDGTFKPNNTITRAEFATVLVKALKLAPSSSKVFADTANHWAKDSISAAAAAGIVNGYSATQFGPNDPITREQMAVMITKAAKLAKAEGKTFSDGAAIAAWAKDAVASATAASVMSGYPDNSFKPQGNATRAEAVTVIVKAIK